MTDKPRYIDGYDVQQTKLVRATCLDLATRMGDLMDDLVIVGGMVPGLIVAQDSLPPGAEPYCGTLDIDLGLAVALFDDKRYQGFTDRLSSAGFEPGRKESGSITRQRWRLTDDHSLTIDFLVGPSSEDEHQRQGRLRSIESYLAAVIVPGLHLAFVDRQSVTLAGTTRLGERAECRVSVAGPAAFVALKALAFDNRGENKDAYDLFYVLRNFGASLDDVVERFKPLRGDDQLEEALAVIEREFTEEDHTGPMRVSRFIHKRIDSGTLTDIVGFARELLAKVGSQRSS